MKKKKFELIFPGYTYFEESKPDAGRIVLVQLDFTRNGRWSSTSFTICKVCDDGSLFYEDKKKKLKTLKEGDLDSRGDVQHITAWKYIEIMKTIEKLKEIILDNNYFDTLAGQRFKEWNDIDRYSAVISFSGRSKEQKSYELDKDSYVTHLMLDKYGNILVQISDEDTDDFSVILRPGNTRPVTDFSENYLEEWVELLTF